MCESPPLRTSYLILARRGVGTEVTTARGEGLCHHCHHSDTNSNIQPNCEAVARLHTQHGSTQCQAPGAGNQRRSFTVSSLPLADRRESKCDDPLSSSHVEAHEAELHGYRISGIRPEPILTKSGGKSCWSMLTVLLASAGRRLCVQGDMELILLLPLLPAPGASAPCTPAPGGQQTTVYKHATTCWVQVGVVQQLTPAGHY